MLHTLAHPSPHENTIGHPKLDYQGVKPYPSSHEGLF